MAERLIALAAASFVGAAALAQPLGDPMRPPTPGPAVVRHSEPAYSRLQSVLVSPGRKVAVIDGRTVRVGDRIGDAILVSIEASEVTLQRGLARERLTLLPRAVEKRPVKR